VTDGVSTDPADFTVTPAVVVEPDPADEDDILTAQLRSWGLSGEPVTWAPSKWHAAIVAIRAANTGFGTQATVDGLLDTTFPDNDLSASDICLTPPPDPTITPTLGQTPGTIVLSVAATGVPPENVNWLVDGRDRYQGVSTPDLVLDLGDHEANSYVAVAGVVYTAEREGTVTEDTTTPGGRKWVDR
jgi:hypothetical protein